MKIYPPVIAGVYILIALGIDYLFTGSKIIGPPFNYSGGFLMVAGIGLMLWAANTFKNGNTTHNPFGMPSTLITIGPFRFSRNPMYLGFSIALLGLAIMIGTVPLFFVPIAFSITMHNFFIPREERRLEFLFRKKFTEYKKRVRTWM